MYRYDCWGVTCHHYQECQEVRELCVGSDSQIEHKLGVVNDDSACYRSSERNHSGNKSKHDGFLGFRLPCSRSI